MSVCDFLFSADMLVPRPREAVDQMIETIGLPQPGPRAYVDYEDSGWDCVFALVNKAWDVGPTRLEVIGPKRYPGTPQPSRGQNIADVQGTKPCKTHATVIATPDMSALAEHVKRLGLRHWLEPGSGKTSFDRLWMGIAGEDFTYQPEADAGLIVEVIPSDSNAFVPKLFQKTPPEPVDPVPGQMIRILSRAYIVDDLDQTLKVVSQNLLWEPAHSVVEDPDAGYRYAIMSRNFSQGAALKLVQPTSPATHTGAYHARWGSGAYTIRIAVHDLAAKCDLLRSQGTRFTDVAATVHEPERVCVDPSFTAEMPFEFVEHGAAMALEPAPTPRMNRSPQISMSDRTR